MGIVDYFDRFWFAAEPIFGVIMTLVFLGILRNQSLCSYPQLLERVAQFIVGAAISCCIAWGIVDGIFYAWENHALTARRNTIAKYAKDDKQQNESLKMIEEDLQDTYVDLLNEEEKKNVYEMVKSNLAKSESKAKASIKDDLITIFLDFGLNFGACLVIILPLIILQNVFTIPQLLNLAVVIAVVLIFFIGVWSETRKGLWYKVKKGII